MLQACRGEHLRERFDQIARFALRPVSSANELARSLADTYRAIFSVHLDHYDAADVARMAPDLMRRMFELRVALRSRIDEWRHAGFMSRDVERALRDVFRAARYAGDMLGELSIGFEKHVDGDPMPRAFAGLEHQTFFAADAGGQPFAFRSGDVMLVRGLHHNSAAIARIGDVDTQFSHLSMIYVDQAGKAFVVESLIEEGAIINTLDYALEHGLGRAVVYRHKDAALAARAAELIHAHVTKSRNGEAPHIYYDFTMVPSGYKELFCSKLVRLAFEMASEGAVVLPSYPTRFDMRNRDFIDRIGVKAIETFAPGDIELEPAFDLVAEWQDYRVTSRLRLQDLIMTKLFAWMEEHDYRFKEDMLVRVVGLFGRLASHLSERVKTFIADVVPKVPDNMTRRTIAAVAMLHRTAQPLLDELTMAETSRIRDTGRPLHAKDVFAHLERRRSELGRTIGYLVTNTPGP
ncbi:MAG: YiiX/YebB-like N1pC/P60 family cysteine hydrolase [Hyphomicrobiaceae bacterium]